MHASETFYFILFYFGVRGSAPIGNFSRVAKIERIKKARTMGINCRHLLVNRARTGVDPGEYKALSSDDEAISFHIVLFFPFPALVPQAKKPVRMGRW